MHFTPLLEAPLSSVTYMHIIQRSSTANLAGRPELEQKERLTGILAQVLMSDQPINSKNLPAEFKDAAEGLEKVRQNVQKGIVGANTDYQQQVSQYVENLTKTGTQRKVLNFGSVQRGVENSMVAAIPKLTTWEPLDKKVTAPSLPSQPIIGNQRKHSREQGIGD